MKRILKGDEPGSLQAFRAAQPQATWEELRDDALHCGKQAYADIRTQTHQDQNGLCAYCEIDIRDNNPLKSRIEHFHPNSDTGSATNWALDWPNMMAVCAGGSFRHGEAPHTLEPLDQNLSCDAHKDRMIQQGQLPESCEGWVLNPLGLPARPSLFTLNKFDGSLSPDATACATAAPLPDNRHISVAELVQHTIDMLNLNCERLRQARLQVIWDIERNKKRQRDANIPASQALPRLAQRYFRTRWPQFFTTISLCLGTAAEAHLQAVHYQG